MNIYVGNLNYAVTEEELQEVFQEYGSVSSVKIIRDQHSGRAKGFAFVSMDDDSEANNAIEKLNQTEIFGRTLKVSQAKDRGERRDNSFNKSLDESPSSED
ncbi:MAG: RNA-binding protein [Bacteroidetes bacterium]|nr:RNA-binding protein [Bacteroidota bacterium]MBL6963052.1 RNA-binding protein [Bacteroidota bacterium]